MGAYLGPLGSLVEFVHWREKQKRSTTRAGVTRTTMDGSRTAFVAPRGHREWAMAATDMSPEQAARFELLTAGVYGPPPWRFIDPLAQVTNVLTLRSSLPGAGNEHAYSSSGSPSAARIAEVGAVPAVTAPANADLWLAYGTPAVPGIPVTVSAWVRGSGSGSIRAVFIGADGLTTTEAVATYTTPAGWTRVTASGVPDYAAQEVRILIRSTGGFAAALPVVTWTPKLMPYSPGRGCGKVIIPGFDDSTTWADPDPDGQRLSDYEFTVLEVGDGA